jgi:alkaline phosphatase D
MLAGDSHANWVFDITLDDQTGYDPATGQGSYGVEFAGTAISSPSPFGRNLTYHAHLNISDYYLRSNNELLYTPLLLN